MEEYKAQLVKQQELIDLEIKRNLFRKNLNKLGFSENEISLDAGGEVSRNISDKMSNDGSHSASCETLKVLDGSATGMTTDLDEGSSYKIQGKGPK